MPSNQNNVIKQKLEKARKKRLYIRYVAFGAFVPLVGIIVLFFLDQSKDVGDNNIKVNRKIEKRVKKVKIKTAKNNGSTKRDNETTVVKENSSSETSSKTPEEIEVEERKKDPLYDRHHIVAKKPLVKEPIEQLMLTIFTTDLGDMPPMLPAIPAFDEKEFEKMINRTTSVEEGDSQEALFSKEIVNAVKKELANYLKEGGTTSGFLSYYVNELDSAFKEREMCKELAMKAMKREDPEVARQLYLEINSKLKSKGIKPLTLTKRQKAHLGIEE